MELADAVSRLPGGVVLYVRSWLCPLFEVCGITSGTIHMNF
ncbi:hypothetical protein CSC26_5439 [Pseudomonas aeruginosa]|nr:hypothetical protein CSC26_5439 [Pseudomonas aeruginosa]